MILGGVKILPGFLKKWVELFFGTFTYGSVRAVGKKSKKRQAISLFLTMLILMRRRGGSDNSFLKPSRPSFKTPRFSDVDSCAQARWFRRRRLRSPTPVREK